jgi:hypothetical protein
MRYKISSELIEAFSLCPRKAFLLMTRATASPGPHEYEMGVTTGFPSPSFPYNAIEPLIFVLHVVCPEGVPFSVEIGPSQIQHRLRA